MPKQAVLLLAHGTPETVEQIPEYLRNVVSGRPVPQHVVEEIQHRYSLIGHSPLTELSMEQARLAEAGGPARLDHLGADLGRAGRTGPQVEPGHCDRIGEGQHLADGPGRQGEQEPAVRAPVAVPAPVEHRAEDGAVTGQGRRGVELGCAHSGGAHQGSVRISEPSSVTRSVCSNCAVRLWSLVTAVQPSDQTS